MPAHLKRKSLCCSVPLLVQVPRLSHYNNTPAPFPTHRFQLMMSCTGDSFSSHSATVTTPFRRQPKPLIEPTINHTTSHDPLLTSMRSKHQKFVTTSLFFSFFFVSSPLQVYHIMLRRDCCYPTSCCSRLVPTHLGACHLLPRSRPYERRTVTPVQSRPAWQWNPTTVDSPCGETALAGARHNNVLLE